MSFPLFFDEHIDVRLAKLLIAGGVDVLTTPEAGRAAKGLSDDDQLAFAASQGRALLTYDPDFLAVAADWQARGLKHCGIILSKPLRLREMQDGLHRLFALYPNGLDFLVWLPPSSRG